MRKIVLCVLLVGFFFAVAVHFVKADELDDITSQLSELNNLLSSSEKATEYNEEQLASLNSQLEAIKLQVEAIESSIQTKEEEIDIGEKKLIQQKESLDGRIREYYKNKGKEKDLLLHILVSDNLSNFLKQFIYQQNLLDDNRQAIITTALLVRDIEEKKQVLENEKRRLEPIKQEVAKQSAFLEGEVLSAKQYQSQLKKQIAELSARQQEIIAQKQASLNLPASLGSGSLLCTDDRDLNPGFGNAFAFYTFGIPHRVGMSQYGAYGRAKDGQNAEQILNAYFANFELKKDYDQNITISVQGYGDYSIEEYTKRIYEMPESWGDNGGLEALKAQAIAARSYALSYTNNGQNSICTTQSCQVFKPDPKTGAWARAVDETKGWVMTQGGSPITAWYASTAGGYTFRNSQVWGGSDRSWTKNLQDGRSGYGSFQDVINNAYDRDSPCMYAAQGWRSEYGKSAWLKSEEVADIANVILLARQLSAEDKEHLYQPDKPNPAGKETWDFERVKSELRNKGTTPLNSVQSVSIGADFSSGQSTSVSISGDSGSHSFNASEFKDWFNLRAPANLQIVGPLFNVERK